MFYALWRKNYAGRVLDREPERMSEMKRALTMMDADTIDGKRQRAAREGCCLMRIPFFGRKPEPFTEGQIEYLRRYNLLPSMLGDMRRALPLSPAFRGWCLHRHRRARANLISNGTTTPWRSGSASRLTPLSKPDPTPDPIDWAVGVLNSALVCDAAAIQSLMALEVQVNESLSGTPDDTGWH